MKLKKIHKKIGTHSKLLQIFLLKASVFKNSFRKKGVKRYNTHLIRVNTGYY